MKLIRNCITITAILWLCSINCQTIAQTKWYKYPGNPVFEPGKNGKWDQHIIDFVVIFEGDQFHMWYSAWAKDVTGFSAFGYATSPDGIHWEKYEENPLIFNCESSPWDSKYWTFDIIRKDSLFLMWYTAEPKDTRLSASIGFAWSADGFNWTKYPKPVLGHGKGDAWDVSGIGDPCVVFEGNIYHMWYNGIPDRMPKIVQVGYATSVDGIHWKKHPANPVLDVGKPGSFEDRWVVSTDVNFNGSVYEMWYFGYNQIQFEIGLATSTDGVNWTRSPENPVMKTGEAGSWDAAMVVVSSVLIIDSVYCMWYWGNDNIHTKMGYATTSADEAGKWDIAGIPGQQREVRVQLFNKLEFIKVDSLIRILPELTGTAWIDACNKLALAYSLNDYVKSYFYAEKALELAKKDAYPKGRAMALYSIGNSQYVLDNYSEALASQLAALRIFDSLGMQHEAGNLLSQIASIHSYSGSYDVASRYHQQALEVFEALRDTGSILLTLDYLGNVYLQAGDTSQVLKAFQNKLSLAKESENIRAQGNANEALGESYQGRSLDSSLFYFAEARKIWDTLDWPQLGITYLKMAEACYASGPEHYSEAEENYLKSYHILIAAIGGGQDQLRLCKGLAELYYHTGRLDKAREYLDLSLEMCQTFLSKHNHQMYVSLNNKLEYDIFLKAFMEKIYRLYYRLDSTIQDKDAALQHYMLATAWRDSVSNDQNWKKVAMIQGQHETEISHNQITMLEKENEVQNLIIRQSRFYMFAMGVFLVIFIFMAFLFIRQNKIRAEHRSVALEQKLLRLQMNPHFIFNALSNILNFINRKDLDKATDYLTSFSHLLRSTLESSREDYIHLEEEINSLRYYLNLQALRYTDKFEFSIDVDEHIDLENAIIPPMLIQPFVENSIDHGIKDKAGKGHIYIRFRLVQKKVICEVEDDGVGRVIAAKAKYQVRKTHKSLATEIIMERIQSLNKKLKNKIHLSIIDLKTENNLPSGTKVVLDLPYLID